MIATTYPGSIAVTPKQVTSDLNLLRWLGEPWAVPPRINIYPEGLASIQTIALLPNVVSEPVITTSLASAYTLQKEFELLAKQWKEQTFPDSSLTKIFSHPAYIRIIAMGKDAIPMVLRELQNNQSGWFYALKFMAGVDVAAGIKNFEDAKAAWLEWGYKNNYI